MTEPSPQPPSSSSPGREPVELPVGMLGSMSPRYRITRRQQRIRDGVERSRRGEHKVPTWVLGLILLAIIGLLAALMLMS